MLAVRRASRRHGVARRLQFFAGADGDIIGGAKPAQGEAHAIERRLTVHEREALGEHHLERKSDYTVEHARSGADRVVLDRHGGAEDLGRMPTGGELHSVEAKRQAAISERLADIVGRNQERPHLSVDQAGEECARL